MSLRWVAMTLTAFCSMFGEALKIIYPITINIVFIFILNKVTSKQFYYDFFEVIRPTLVRYFRDTQDFRGLDHHDLTSFQPSWAVITNAQSAISKWS